MKTKIICCSLLLFAGIIFFGCRKETKNDTPTEEEGKYDVYMGGSETSSNGISVAKIWKNGVGAALTDGVRHAGVKSVFVIGNDVYAAGSENSPFDASLKVAMLWKNGVATALTGGRSDAEAYSVFVKGKNVYVAGYETTSRPGKRPEAKLWINGTPKPLTYAGPDSYAKAYSVFVSDDE